MRFILLCPLLVSLATSASAQIDPSYRAFWADAFSVGFKSTIEINSLVSRAVSGNYNMIIAEVLAFQDRGSSAHGAYWNSSIVPKAADINGNIDPLAQLVTVAHAAGIEVHAWIVPFRTSSSWPPGGNSLLAAHPEWLMVPIAGIDNGPARVAGFYTLDPGSPDVQQYLTSIVQELVTNYEIDGVNLDFIRYVQTDAGYPSNATYNSSTLARFQQLTGFVGVPSPTGVASWNDFRRQTITEFVRRLRAEIASIPNPRRPLRLSGDLIVFGDAPFSFTSTDAYRLHQNWKLWMERGYLDLGIPMNYKREHLANQAQWYRNWVTRGLTWRFARHMAIGQGNYLNTMANSVTQLDFALSAGADGTCNFSYDNTADQNLDGTSEIDWSWYPFVSTNLFTSPASTPSMPWRDPATATEGTLWGRVIDASTGLPIDGANVQVGTLAPVATDGNGYYVATLIPATSGGTTYNVAASGGSCPDVAAADAIVLPGDIVRLDIDLCAIDIGPGDMDGDGDIDQNDFSLFAFCMQGPGATFAAGNFCLSGDADADRDDDLLDFASFQRAFGP